MSSDSGETLYERFSSFTSLPLSLSEASSAYFYSCLNIFWMCIFKLILRCHLSCVLLVKLSFSHHPPPFFLSCFSPLHCPLSLFHLTPRRLSSLLLSRFKFRFGVSLHCIQATYPPYVKNQSCSSAPLIFSHHPPFLSSCLSLFNYFILCLSDETVSSCHVVMCCLYEHVFVHVCVCVFAMLWCVNPQLIPPIQASGCADRQSR